MHDYDTVLKSLLTGSENSIFERITGAHQGRWLNVELPDVTQTRVDLSFETIEAITAARRLIAMESQSTNDLLLPLRFTHNFQSNMSCTSVQRKMRMPAALEGRNHVCRYTIVDIRNFDAETLLNRPFPADTVIAILARYSERPETIRRILARIAKLGKGAALDAAFSKLLILAGIRKLSEAVRQEAKYMPILDDMMDHDLFGPAIRQGLEQGRRESREAAKQEEAPSSIPASL